MESVPVSHSKDSLSRVTSCTEYLPVSYYTLGGICFCKSLHPECVESVLVSHADDRLSCVISCTESVPVSHYTLCGICPDRLLHPVLNLSR